jgi:hypothetical protein
MAEDNQKPESAPPTPPPLVGVSKLANEDMLEPGEHVLTIVRRTVIGLLGIYLVAFVAVVAIIALMILLAPGTFDTSEPNISPQLSAIMILGAFLLVLILFAVTYIYRQSRLIITDRSLVQVVQRTLFIRKVSRLNFSNVEDVSAEQRGILASIFDYGTLLVQTAGERDNFEFGFCPHPNVLADRIIEARQRYAEALQEENEQHQD